jgi:hypothetical protein
MFPLFAMKLADLECTARLATASTGTANAVKELKTTNNGKLIQ